VTGADGADGDGVDDDVDADEDLDELHPVSSSLRTAQEQERGTDRVVEAGDVQAESKNSDGDGSGLDELAPVTSAVRTAQSPSDVDAAGDDGDEGCGDDD